MGEFGWAHVTGQKAVGISGSVQLANTDGSLNGVPELYYRDGQLHLTGTLNVGGEINAERMNFTVVNKTVTNINSDGSTKFGDTSGDLHQFTGSISVYQGDMELHGGTMHLSGAHPSLLFYSSSVDGIVNLDSVTEGANADYQYAQNPALVVTGSTVLLGETAIHGSIGGTSPVRFLTPIRSYGAGGEQFDIAGGDFTGNMRVCGGSEFHSSNPAHIVDVHMDVHLRTDDKIKFGDNQEASIGYMTGSSVLEISGSDLSTSNNINLVGSRYVVFGDPIVPAEDKIGFKNDNGTIKYKHQGEQWKKIGTSSVQGQGPEGSVQVMTNGSPSGSADLMFSSGSLTISGDLEVGGSITAEELVVRITNEVVTEINTSGSTVFGNTPDDTHIFNGKATFNQGMSVNRVLVNGDYTMQATDYIIGVNTNMDSISITLPDASQLSSGQIFVIKDEAGNSEANPIQINVQVGGQLIDGQQSFFLYSNFAALSIYSDGQNNFMIF